MHGAKHEHHHADLATDRFEHLANIHGGDALLQGERYVADIDKVKADDEKVINRIGQKFVRGKNQSERCVRFYAVSALPIR